jgi:hypothetical protein
MQVWVVEHSYPLQEGSPGMILGIFSSEDSAKSFVDEWIASDIERRRMKGVVAKWEPSTWSPNHWWTDNGWQAVSLTCHEVK